MDFFSSNTYADKGTASVTDHNSDGQRNNGQRKDNRIGGVAI